jgi:hypothetical protein
VTDATAIHADLEVAWSSAILGDGTAPAADQLLSFQNGYRQHANRSGSRMQTAERGHSFHHSGRSGLPAVKKIPNFAIDIYYSCHKRYDNRRTSSWFLMITEGDSRFVRLYCGLWTLLPQLDATISVSPMECPTR